MSLVDITAHDKPCTFVPASGNRFYISRPDALLLMCKKCGGAVAVILHVPVSETHLPALRQCKCEELVTDRGIQKAIERVFGPEVS